jgi:hypothetical protein
MNEAYDCGDWGGPPDPLWHPRRAGHKVLRSNASPRFHIGESLMPETYWRLALGMPPKPKNSEFVKKYSVQFVTASGREASRSHFDERPACSQTCGPVEPV